MPAKRFIAKPVVLNAIKWEGDNFEEVKEFCNKFLAHMINGQLYIDTINGRIRAHDDDWIAQGIQGEFYPIREMILEGKYIETDKDYVLVEKSKQLTYRELEMIHKLLIWEANRDDHPEMSHEDIEALIEKVQSNIADAEQESD